ncbi:MAG TPA: hypothetical protein VJ256_07750, partial [Dehalococcoidia bacterium]|nr:hypothetical protein [Dehalococcoidia bacterium]
MLGTLAADDNGYVDMAPVLIVETTTSELGTHKFGGPTASLVYFLSFAHAERYGSDHALAQAAAILKRRLHINMAPLLTFGAARSE